MTKKECGVQVNRIQEMLRPVVSTRESSKSSNRNEIFAELEEEIGKLKDDIGHET